MVSCLLYLNKAQPLKKVHGSNPIIIMTISRQVPTKCNDKIGGFFKFVGFKIINVIIFWSFAINIGEFDHLYPYVLRAGFAPASEVAGGHTIPF
jgi:hypothetical protein